MKGGTQMPVEPTPDIANLDRSELVSNQEAVPVPWFVGEAKIAPKWIAPIYGLYWIDATIGGGKK
jgi:hypothetical protein